MRNESPGADGPRTGVPQVSRRVMRVLGLSPAEEDVYRRLLAEPEVPTRHLRSVLGARAGTVEAALDRLRELGVVEEHGEGWRAQEPDAAVARLVDDRMDHLLRQVRALAHTGSVVEELERHRADTPVPPDGEAPAETALVERITDPVELQLRLRALSFISCAELLTAEPTDVLTTDHIRRTEPVKHRHLRQGTTVRQLVAPDALEDPLVVRHLRELAFAGALVRVAPELDRTLTVHDREVAHLPADPVDGDRGTLCVREPGLVDTLVREFERLWEEAEEFDGADTPTDPEGDGAISEVQAQVLAAMCRASKDETGARRVGLSLRTYRRHVAELIHLLGADNRVHAALLARDRGWL